ncbi:Protein ABC1-like protein, mitochondrial [Psilocybe cubensis]|uniref:Protein ABC1-like protein, mitochondrial n=2 Tax=Psilocybe cubensis TaxID=181762 RepID=A0ACB8GN10_PSICU|nr:Protein ABC1-like protein, mitochondrial [Psilocybe cubensis]KAH9476782.1 Protein ABC1-like protein, mitochondrial [Psilocybe cubensis]
MPPGPAYNWLCVLASTAEILSNAARYRAAQVAPNYLATSYANPRKRRRTEDTEWQQTVEHVNDGPQSSSGSALASQYAAREALVEDIRPTVAAAPVVERIIVEEIQIPEADVRKLSEQSEPASDASPVVDTSLKPEDPNVEELAAQKPAASLAAGLESYPPQMSRNLQSSKVPSSRIGRLFHYGGLAASLTYGAASEVLRRTGSGTSGESSVMMTEANIRRLVSKLSQMRGAALKLGQFMSIQDTHILPPEIDKIFRRVQDSAHYMPDWQMEQVMTQSLGPSWLDNFVSFDRIPFAAASIGQVHTAVLAASVSPTGKEERVAVKIQFPNIVNSIESDLGYIKMLLTAGKLLPKGLFLDKTISVMKGELADECDYVREASFLKTFGSPDCLGNDPRFKVPWVWDGSTATVLVMERVDGVNVGEANAQNLTQQDRNDISAWIIELCLKELFEFRAMQTDPNWTNFLWNSKTRQVELVDFGATRTYSKEFMDSWLALLQAAAVGDRDTCIDWSRKVGYLTGEENEVMLNAHVNSMTLLATPFKAETRQPFSFGPGSQWADITAEIRAQIPVMLAHRLTPPPKETYSLNRKLSGSFLLASRLGAEVDTKVIWDKVVGKYRFG